jgi:hypothetical protein
MARTARKKPPTNRTTVITDPAVGAVFNAYPNPLRARLLALRRLILDTASKTEGVGELEETLKWGQPSYLTTATKSGSTIRIDAVKAASPYQYAMYVHCQANLVVTFRELYPKDMTYGGNRSIVFHANEDVPEEALRHCVALALTYHLHKRKSSR